jgi:hypothetical protein
MKNLLSLAFILALAMTVSQVAFACPTGFAACGESGQLCCPIPPAP